MWCVFSFVLPLLAHFSSTISLKQQFASAFNVTRRTIPPSVPAKLYKRMKGTAGDEGTKKKIVESPRKLSSPGAIFSFLSFPVKMVRYIQSVYMVRLFLLWNS